MSGGSGQRGVPLRHGQSLSGDPRFVLFDAYIIRNLGLDFQVVYAGSEAALIDAVESAFDRHARSRE